MIVEGMISFPMWFMLVSVGAGIAERDGHAAPHWGDGRCTGPLGTLAVVRDWI